MEFSQKIQFPVNSVEKANELLCLYLSGFSIQCISSYCRGTAIPEIDKSSSEIADYFLVSKYIIDLRNKSPERFEDFMILVQGHMLANGLLCDDLYNTPRNFREVSFYFDTPLVIQILGLDGDEKMESCNELVQFLQRLHGKIAVFSHTRDEIKHVIRQSSKFIDSKEGRGRIVRNARNKNLAMSDLILYAEKLDELLAEKIY